MVIAGLLKKAVESFKDYDALLDLEVVMSHLLGVDRSYLISHGDFEVDDFDSKLFDSYVERIRNGEPVAYIVNEKEFYGLNFYVDKRVLVPRPETEQIVDIVIKYIGENKVDGEKFRVVDVGTGSGNIAVSIAKHFENGGDISQIDAVDVSNEALEVAKININQHGVEHLVFAYQSDLLDVFEEDEDCGIIVSNLPYIGEVKNKFVSENVEKFEPNVALFGGNDGLELYKKMFQQVIEKRLKFNLIAGEFGFSQREEMEKLLNKYFEHKFEIKKDLAGIDRIFIVYS